MVAEYSFSWGPAAVRNELTDVQANVSDRSEPLYRGNLTVQSNSKDLLFMLYTGTCMRSGGIDGGAGDFYDEVETVQIDGYTPGRRLEVESDRTMYVGTGQCGTGKSPEGKRMVTLSGNEVPFLRSQIGVIIGTIPESKSFRMLQILRKRWDGNPLDMKSYKGPDAYRRTYNDLLSYEAKTLGLLQPAAGLA